MDKMTVSLVISLVFIISMITTGQGQIYGGCSEVHSQYCAKYGFNNAYFPNYVGMASLAAAEAQLGSILQQIKFCTIPRQRAEMIGCAMYVPLCVNGKRIPPCSEDCTEVITTCKIDQLPGLGMAKMICGIFPKRVTGGCITEQKSNGTQAHG